MNEEKFKKILAQKEKAKIIAKQKKNTMWLSLGMIGLVGWSIVIPTFIGIAIGIVVDKKFPSQFSWTLMFLFLGLIIGCINAWYWVAKERKSIEKDKK